MPKRVSCLDHVSMALVQVDKKDVKLYATCTLKACFMLTDSSSLQTYAKRFDVAESLTVLRRRVGVKQSGAVHVVVVCGVVIRRDSLFLQNCKLRLGWGSARLPSNYQAIDKFIVKRKFGDVTQNPDETATNNSDEHQEPSNATSSGSACVQTIAESLDEPVAKRLCSESTPDASLEDVVIPGQGNHIDVHVPDEEPGAQDMASTETAPAETTCETIAVDDIAVSVERMSHELCPTLLDC